MMGRKVLTPEELARQANSPDESAPLVNLPQYMMDHFSFGSAPGAVGIVLHSYLMPDANGLMPEAPHSVPVAVIRAHPMTALQLGRALVEQLEPVVDRIRKQTEESPDRNVQ